MHLCLCVIKCNKCLALSKYFRIACTGLKQLMHAACTKWFWDLVRLVNSVTANSSLYTYIYIDCSIGVYFIELPNEGNMTLVPFPAQVNNFILRTTVYDAYEMFDIFLESRTQYCGHGVHTVYSYMHLTIHHTHMHTHVRTHAHTHAHTILCKHSYTYI